MRKKSLVPSRLLKKGVGGVASAAGSDAGRRDEGDAGAHRGGAATPQTAPRRRNRLRWLASCSRRLSSEKPPPRRESPASRVAKGQTRRPHPFFSSLLVVDSFLQRPRCRGRRGGIQLNNVGPHHLVVLVVDDVAVPYVAVLQLTAGVEGIVQIRRRRAHRQVNRGPPDSYARHLAGTHHHRVLPPSFVRLRRLRGTLEEGTHCGIAAHRAVGVGEVVVVGRAEAVYD